MTDEKDDDEIDLTFWHDDEASEWRAELYLDAEDDEPVELSAHTLRELFREVQQRVLKDHYGENFRNFRPPSSAKRHLRAVT